MRKFLSRFQRITSSGGYIPEIDGLRFLAIITVITFHVRGAFITFNDKHPGHYADNLQDSFIYRFLANGHQGVEIFFAISGFILSLPFINHYRYHGKEITLKKFYLRRVSRLEPPYLLALIILFIGVLINGEFRFGELFPSLLASMVYIHSLVFSGLPKVTTVTWSLEVEVQFYLLTPLLMRMFVLPKKSTRAILICFILLMPLLQNFVPDNVNWLYKFFQYFGIGILLADLYLDKKSIIYKIKNGFFSVAGFILLIALLAVNGHVNATSPSNVSPGLPLFEKMAYPFLILSFFVIVLGNSFWKRLFSIQLISVIGGMCYSIYLLHTAIISLFGRFIFKLGFTHSAGVGYMACFVSLTIIIVVISSLFFLLIEKPCMEKEWYKKFFIKSSLPSIKKESA